MTNKLPIISASNGSTGVIEWEGDERTFVAMLSDPDHSLVIRLDEQKILFSVGPTDLEKTRKFKPESYESTHRKNNIFFQRALTALELANVHHVIDILVNNGNISGSGVNIKEVTSGTFINFMFGRQEDCALVKAYLNYL